MKQPTKGYSDSDGHFRRKDSVFRNFISRDSNATFAAEKDRYVLYVNYGCPWAHRTILIRGLKSLEPFIQLIRTDNVLTDQGWLFTGRNGSPPAEPLYGFTNLKQLYLKADPNYTGRYTVPVLWDKKRETIVNNESSEVIRMLYDCFDDFLEPHQREVNKPGGGFYPPQLRQEIDAMNDWVYNTVNNGVYKVGFAMSQDAYDANIFPLFSSLDRLEEHLASPEHQPYLFGEHLTEADIRLYTTIARFDVAYHTVFQCNLKMIRHDYPRLNRWYRNLYWDESDRTNGGVFRKTTFFDYYKYGYVSAKTKHMYGSSATELPVILPRGPVPDIQPLTDEEEQLMINGSRSPRASTGVQSASRKLNSLVLDNSTATQSSDGAVQSAGTNTTAIPTPLSNMGSIFGAESDSVVNQNDNDGEEINDADEMGFSPKKIKKATTYNDENAKWYKAAKKAEKKTGAPNMHLAL